MARRRLPAHVFLSGPWWAGPQVVDYLGALLARGDSPGQAVLALVEQCLSREGPVPPTHDNVTILLARLK